MYNVFIDGREGTTGLQIFERLAKRGDVNIIALPEEKRKDPKARKECLNSADISFLCLPDAAARESVSLIENKRARVIDASTAHRTNPEWVYGLPEISKERRGEIAESNRVANPGCHATGFISLVAPLVKGGIVGADYPFVAHSVTGYSGGGKKMIAEYEAADVPPLYGTPRLYGLNLKHKHLAEMKAVCGLENPPVFCPVVDDYYAGMAVTVMLSNSQLKGTPSAKDIWECLAAHYEGKKLINVHPFGYEEPMIAAGTMEGKDNLKLIVNGHENQTIITALFDNLGKGASGAAVQNMNLMLGFDETAGLTIGEGVNP